MSELHIANTQEIQDVLEQLNNPPGGELPVEAIRTVQARAEEFTPYLIDLIRRATEAVKRGDDFWDTGYVIAYYLLAEFKAQLAWPVIRDALLLPDEGPFELFGDGITEDVSRVLPVFASERPELLDELIVNREANEYVRWAAVSAFLHLVRSGRLTREEVAARLRNHLQTALQNNDEQIVSPLVYELMVYGAAGAMEEIREACRRDLVDETFTDLTDIEDSLACDNFPNYLERCPETGVSDTVEELRPWWNPDWHNSVIEDGDDFDAVHESWAESESESESLPIYESLPRPEPIRYDSPHIGRNDPCPCGSGKKYKKCCLRNS